MSAIIRLLKSYAEEFDLQLTDDAKYRRLYNLLREAWIEYDIHGFAKATQPQTEAGSRNE